MANNQSLKSKFQCMVPFYLNHTLNAEDQAFFNQTLLMHPEWQALIDFDAQLKQSVLTQPVPISAEASYARFRAQRRTLETPWWKKINIHFALIEGYATPIVACCLLVMIGQFAYIAQLQTLDDSPQFRSWRILQTKQTRYKLIVKPEVKVAEVVRLLQETHCQLVSGPNEQGQFIVSCQSDSSSIQTIFEKSPLLNDVLPAK